MPKRKKAAKNPKKWLDKVSRQQPSSRIHPASTRKRGRPGVQASEIAGRSFNYRYIFEDVWDKLSEPLLKATCVEQVTKALKQFGQPYSNEFVPHLSKLFLQVIQEPKFPKRPNTQVAFLADSLAGLGRVSPRRSRDICERQRNFPAHKIIRQEFYIECTCKYKGPALHGRCPKCGTGEIAWININSG